MMPLGVTSGSLIVATASLRVKALRHRGRPAHHSAGELTAAAIVTALRVTLETSILDGVRADVAAL
jgi:hypothetical protein